MTLAPSTVSWTKCLDTSLMARASWTPGPSTAGAGVGNSGNLQASHYGAQIDLSDVVFRMNGAPTKDYEEDVGKKTTFHLMYLESAVDMADSSTHLLLVPLKRMTSSG
ncbi:unnamed protein product [Merluccius merluccius]